MPPADAPAVELVVMPPRGYARSLEEILTDVAVRFDGGILMSATLPFETVAKTAERLGMDLSEFHVIDLVTALGNKGIADTEFVSYVPSPTLLEKALILALDRMQRTPARQRCIVVDSLSTLEFYNPTSALEQFTHRLVSIARSNGWSARFLVTDNAKNAWLLEDLVPVFDRVARHGQPSDAAPGQMPADRFSY